VNGCTEVTVGIIGIIGVVITRGKDLVEGIGVISWVSVGIISTAVVRLGRGESVGEGVGVSGVNCIGVSVTFGIIVEVGIVVRGVS